METPVKRRRAIDREHKLQCACVKWFYYQYPTLRGLLFAVPNGSRRDIVTASKLKAEGVVAGVSDLILLKKTKQYGALLIEMKTATGRQSTNQKDWEAKVTANNDYKYTIVRSFDEFMAEINDYLNN